MANFDKEFNELQDELHLKFNKEVELMTERIGAILVRETQDVLRANNKVATGFALRSVSSEVVKLSTGFIAGETSVRENVRAYLIKCFMGVNYSQFIYDDTKPHFPPVDKIAEWVKTKQISGRYSIKKSHNRLGSKQQQYNEDRAMAWAIAKKIQRKGTKGIKFFDIALKQAWPVIEKEVESFNLKFK